MLPPARCYHCCVAACIACYDRSLRPFRGLEPERCAEAPESVGGGALELYAGSKPLLPGWLWTVVYTFDRVEESERRFGK